MVKYIFIVGGVISGVGKGVSVASIGKILQMHGLSVTAIKIDPYINYDAGTLRPTEHGEVWVTEDGGEIDQDLGNYERFLSIDIPKRNNITTGQIYKALIDKERQGYFLGKTVQFIPHVLDEIKERIVEAAEGFDIALVEIGGTVGDYENIPFLLAAKSLERELGKENVAYVLVTYLPTPFHIKEAKTKPTQQAIRQLFETGIFPDFILCRATESLDEVRKKKIETYLNIESSCVISAPDVLSLYTIPLNFEEEHLGKKILQKLNLESKKQPDWSKWQQLIENSTTQREVNVAIIGKYLDIGHYQLRDSYISIKEALEHAAAHLGCKVKIFWLDSKQFEHNGVRLETLKDYNGIIIPGGFGTSGIEGKISVIKFCRENNIPFLGLCLGMQLAVVEFARNVCNLDAQSAEVDPHTKNPVIDLMSWQKKILESNNYGATMRLGAYAAILEDSEILEIYKKTGRLEKDMIKINELKKDPNNALRLGILNNAKNIVLERHRHRFEITPKFVDILEKHGLKFSGYHMRSDGTKLMEFIELPNHHCFIATQAHPEFKSRFECPSPMFLKFVKSCLKFE